jgi:hypothetical protein
MNYTTRLYERDEQGKFWPAGKYTFETRKRAIACLEHQVCDGICGLVTTPGFIAAYRNMTGDEALRVSSVKLFEDLKVERS